MKRNLLNLLIKSTLVVSLTFAITIVDAQQDPYFTHYNFVRQMYNPAVVGLDGRWCAFGIAHSQYMGLSDRTQEYTTPTQDVTQRVRGVGPKTNGAGVSMPFNKYDQASQTTRNFGGAGLTFYDDRLGYESNLNVRAQAAYRHFFSDGVSLALGLEGGYLQKGIDGRQMRYIDPNDPNIPTGTEQDGKFTGSVGLFYKNDNINNLQIGLSSTNMLPQQYRFGANGNVVTETARHYYLYGGMEFPNFLGNPELTLMPSMLVKYNSKVQADATALVEYQGTLSGGLAYRSITDAASLLFGYKTNGIRIGVSYDITLSRLNRVSAGTVELCLNYCWDIVPAAPTIIPILTPRWIDRESAGE